MRKRILLEEVNHINKVIILLENFINDPTIPKLRMISDSLRNYPYRENKIFSCFINAIVFTGNEYENKRCKHCPCKSEPLISMINCYGQPGLCLEDPSDDIFFCKDIPVTIKALLEIIGLLKTKLP